MIWKYYLQNQRVATVSYSKWYFQSSQYLRKLTELQANLPNKFWLDSQKYSSNLILTTLYARQPKIYVDDLRLGARKNSADGS